MFRTMFSLTFWRNRSTEGKPFWLSFVDDKIGAHLKGGYTAAERCDLGRRNLVVAPSGKVFDPLMEMLASLNKNQQAELVIISDQKAALDLAKSAIQLPPGIPEWLSPIVSIVAGQLFAYHLTRAKGFDTETPRTIHKVTETN